MNHRLVVVAIGVSALVALTLLVVTGQAAALTVGDPGVLTRWGLPAARAADDLLGAFVLGLFLLRNAPTLSTLDSRLRGNDQARGNDNGTRGNDNSARLDVGYTALFNLTVAWLVAAFATFVFAVSDISGSIDPSAFVEVLTTTTQGPAFVVHFALIVVVALTVPRDTALIPVVLAQFTVVFAGHAVTGERVSPSVLSLLLHVGAASVWIGVVAALVIVRRSLTLEMVQNVSRWAGIAFVVVAVSGVVNAYIRLGEISAFFTTTYGYLVLAKINLLVVLGAFGAHHRRMFINRWDDDVEAPFLRLVTVEIVIMALTIGVAVALSRSMPPVG